MSLGQDWSGAFSLPQLEVASGVAVPRSAGADCASYFCRAVADDSPEVVARITFQTAFAAANVGLPNISFGINHQGGKDGDIYKSDFILVQGIAGAKLYVDGDWRDTNSVSPPLRPDTWYEMEIRQSSSEFTATISTCDGKILQQNTYRSSVKQGSTGAAFIYYKAMGHEVAAGTPKVSAFSLEIAPNMKNDLSRIQHLDAEEVGRIVLVSQDKPRAGILVSNDARAKEMAAAKRLQDYIERMTGVCLPIGELSAAKDVAVRILVGPTAAKSAGVDIPQTYPGGERVVVKTAGSDIVIAGNDVGSYKNTRYAVDVFLEALGCGWFGPNSNWIVVPKSRDLVVSRLNIDVAPAFENRSTFFWQGSHPAFDNDIWGLGGVTLNMNHIFNFLFPPESYYDTHPEYYALVGGKRVAGNAQVCFSNPDVQKMILKMARDLFDKDPNQIMFSLSANDCGGFCECKECRRLGENSAEQSLSFAGVISKELRKTHPDKNVVFYAYWFTHEAPKNVKAAPGVKIILINNSCKVHDLSKTGCPSKKLWIDNYEKWKATGAEVSIYEWYLPSLGGWKHIPWIPGDAALRDVRYYKDNGVRWLYYEGANSETIEDAPLRWPLHYLVAKAMWNTELSAEQILKPACNKLFGKAAIPMLDFYLELADAVEKTPLHSGNWSLPNPRSVYSTRRMKTLNSLLVEALETAKGGPSEVIQRIEDTITCWEKAENTIMSFEPVTWYEVRTPVGIWFSDKQEVDAKYLRELVGINQDRPVFLVKEGGGSKELGEDEKFMLDQMKPITIRAGQ